MSTYTLGSSEVAVVLGLGRTKHDGEPWVSELEVYARLLGLIARYDDDGGPEAEVGRWFEAGVLQRLSVERGWQWGRDIVPGPTLEQPGLKSPSFPWHARPDALAKAVGATVEAKCPRALDSEEWGPTVEDIPPYYAVQVLSQLAIAHELWGWNSGILAAMARVPGWSYGAPKTWATYQLHHQPRRAKLMADRVNAWLDRHVHAGVPPEPDGSQSATNTLRRMFRPIDDKVYEATPTDLERYRRALASRDAADELAARMREEQQHLQAAMADASALVDADGRRLATWRADKNGSRRWRFEVQQGEL